MNPKGNMQNSIQAGIGNKIRSSPLRGDEAINKALEEFMSESDSEARQFVENSFDVFLKKKINDRLRSKIRERRTSPRIIATISSLGPNSSTSRKSYMVLPLGDSKTPDHEEALLSTTAPGISSQRGHCFLMNDSDVEDDENTVNAYERDRDYTEDGKKQKLSKKRSASPKKPSSEGARKKNRVIIELEENHEEGEMKKELVRLEIKNKELDIKKKEALIYFYKLESLRLETQLGMIPSSKEG